MQEGRPEKAFAMLWPLAQAGNAEAQNGVGYLLRHGLGVAKDEESAFQWFQQAADQGHPLGIFNLADCYALGAGITKDCEKAVQLYIASAESGDSARQADLGRMYSQDNAVCIEQDHQQALRWTRAAADQGDPVGQHNLGAAYARGEGVAQDFGEAMKWYELAAAQGYAHSQLMIGYMYMVGEGVEPAPATAARYYRMAAEQGHPEAQAQLGFLYETGMGVPQDLDQALIWYNKAGNQGHADAQQRIAALEAGAGTPHEDEALASLIALPDLELARVYERSSNLLGFIDLADSGINIQAGGRTINKDNAAEVRKELEAQVALCREAIERRGSADIAGTYRVSWTPECEQSKSAWAGLIIADHVAEIVISQTGCDAMLVYEWELEGDRTPIETPVFVVGSAFTFQDFMNSDYVFVGSVEKDTILIRPDTDLVLSAWPQWAGPPKKRNLDRCEVTLVAAN
jgi:TPR repeat protein